MGKTKAKWIIKDTSYFNDSSSTVLTLNSGSTLPLTASHVANVDFSDLSNVPTLLSSSAQISNDISGSFTQDSSSFSSRIESLEGGGSSYISQSGQTVELGGVTATSLTTDTITATGSVYIGDSISDNHYLTGSLHVSGGIYINSASVSQSLVDLKQDIVNLDTDLQGQIVELKFPTEVSGVSASVSLDETTHYNLKGTIKYIVRQDSGSIVKSSELLCVYNGNTSTAYNEYGIVEIGGDYSGAEVGFEASASVVRLKLDVTSGTHNVTFKKFEV